MNAIYGMLLLLLSGHAMAGAFILYTSDSGENWTREDAGISSLNGVAVSVASGVVIAVGDGGTIVLRGEDGIWIDVSPEGLSADLYSVAVGVSDMMACGADGTLLSSFDGGLSWKVWSDFGYEDTDLYSVNFDPTSSNSFLIAGENGFLYSSRDGLVSTGISSDLVASCVMLCSGFPDLVLGRDGIGYHMRNKEDFFIENVHIRGATEMVSGGAAYVAVGENGSIIRNSADNVWESLSSGTVKNLNDVTYMVWGHSLCAVGDWGTVLISGDNGGSWNLFDAGIARDLTAVAGNGGGIACIVGRDALSEVVKVFPFCLLRVE